MRGTANARPPTFGRFALRLGAVDEAQLARARAVRAAEGGSLAAALRRDPSVTGELVALAREAYAQACLQCGRCGRWATDLVGGACPCGARFATAHPEALAELSESDEDALRRAS